MGLRKFFQAAESLERFRWPLEGGRRRPGRHRQCSPADLPLGLRAKRQWGFFHYSCSEDSRIETPASACSCSLLKREFCAAVECSRAGAACFTSDSRRTGQAPRRMNTTSHEEQASSTSRGVARLHGGGESEASVSHRHFCWRFPPSMQRRTVGSWQLGHQRSDQRACCANCRHGVISPESQAPSISHVRPVLLLFRFVSRGLTDRSRNKGKNPYRLNEFCPVSLALA